MRGYQLALGIGQWTMDQTLNVVNLEPAALGLEIRTIDPSGAGDVCVAVELCGWRGPFRRWMSLSRHAVALFVVGEWQSSFVMRICVRR